MKYTIFIICLAFLFFHQKIKAQSAEVKVSSINLFINCQAGCDKDYLKTNVTSVNYMIDRFEANVYLMVTSEQTGSGGEKITLFFEGQKEFISMNDTITYYTQSTDTGDEQREQLASMLKLGLVKYWLRSPVAKQLSLVLPKADSNAKTNPSSIEKDKWKSWIFGIGASGSSNFDDYSSSYSYRGSMSASRVTEKLKISSYNSMAFRKSTWKYEEEEIIVSKNSGASDNEVVLSLGEHFSAGGTLYAGYDEYSNYKLNMSIKPAIEYNFFPYKESVKKSLTLMYSIGPRYTQYFDTSYYSIASSEIVYTQSLSANFSMNQKWGDIYFSSGWHNYLNNFKLEGKKINGYDIYGLWLHGGLSVQLVKGLSISMSAYANFTKGVLPNIPRKEFTRDDLITNSRVYPSSKEYYLYCGINYRFGSKVNNVVNPRFNGSGGSFTFYN